MHVVFRESHGLEEAETPIDLGQDPSDLVVLSYSDSDLGAFAAGWRRGRDKLPSLRLANLVALRHPLSVDTYVERTLMQARGILVRVIGGENYWSYGLATLASLARRRGIALAVLPADGRDDERLDALSTLPTSTLRQLKTLCDAGGAVAAHAALSQLALASGLYPGAFFGETAIDEYGFYDPVKGPIPAPPQPASRPRALVTFYRSYLTAADTAPVDALIAALDAEGFEAYGAFMPSLKAAPNRAPSTGIVNPAPSNTKSLPAPPWRRSRPSMKFIGGEPKKPATKRVRGRRYTSMGGPDCSTLPALRTNRSSAKVIAST